MELRIAPPVSATSAVTAANTAPGPAPAPRVELHVDSLVLTGFRVEHRHQIGGALQGELVRLLEERGLPDRLMGGLDTARLRAAAMALPPDAAPATIGARLAHSVYGALTGQDR